MNWNKPKQQKLDQTSSWKNSKTNEEKQLGFGWNLMGIIHICDLGLGVHQVWFRWDEQGLLD